MGATTGRILVAPIKVEEKEESIPLFITEHKVQADGSLNLKVISLGTKDSKLSRKVTNMNKLMSEVHVCMEAPCGVAGNFLAHCTSLELFLATEFKASEWLGATGYRRWVQLCQDICGVDVSQMEREDVREEAEEASLRSGALRGRAGHRPVERGRERSLRRISFTGLPEGEDDPEAADELSGTSSRSKRKREEETGKGSGSHGRSGGRIETALDSLKSKLRETMEVSGGGSEAAGGLRESKKGEGIVAAQGERKKSDGPRSSSVELGGAPREVANLLKEGSEERRGSTSTLKKSSTPGKALAAVASHAAGEKKELGKKKKKKKGSGNKLLSLLKQVLTKKKKKGKKKKKKKDREGDGGSPSSSGGSDDEDESEDQSGEDSEYSSEEESSEEKKARRLQAPLKRRSLKKKGSVINLLLEQIAEQLQDLSTPQEELLTHGPRVGTYWQVTLRQRHPAGHPALRELFLLATAIDKIRSGNLLESLDALAGRFIAVEAAIQDGWSVARHLEVAVPSDQAIAPTELQLAARKHSNLVAKAHGYEGKGTWRNAGGRGWQSGGGGKDGGKSWWRSRDSGKEGRDGKDRGGKWKKGGKEGSKYKAKGKGEAEGEKAEA